jgi:AraC family transcriptional regulator
VAADNETVSGPQDTFAAFVDVLAQALDDHDIRADELARRAHLSRYHFDRIIAATAGEPPARFRRRILLERAAYRLATTQWTILDISVEAGYSSHEAFTRAFTRAYGATPVHWRRRPTRLPIDAPSNVHFHPPAGLLLPARAKVTSMDLVLTMLRHHVWLLDRMLTRAASIDDERLDRAITLSVTGVDAEPTARSLLARLVGQLEQWDAAIAGREYDFAVERGESVAHMRDRLDRVGPAFVDRVADMVTQGRLEEAIICPGETVEVYTLGAVIAHILTFAAHRRTLVAGALHDAGHDDLDGGDPIRWVTQAH